MELRRSLGMRSGEAADDERRSKYPLLVVHFLTASMGTAQTRAFT